ncbi:MAG: peptide chain release factor N(5)-glutamine methyltransferase [Sphingomonadales bacterium]|nr:MAG: peptide chain release factor N(5)-glutamine methyltransferase [Sphingomonadales bacterium]
MTVADALRDATQQLSKTSDTARLDAELLMAHALGVSRSEMLLRHLGDAVPGEFAALAQRRSRREPIAYILGEAEFFGRSFIVNPAVLIPRPDSECVVEAAIQAAPGTGRVLDLGTGSGALLLTLLAEVPGLEGVGIDASFDALQVAALNSARLGLGDRARMLRANWRDSGWNDGLGRFDLIIANPPYVETSAKLDPNVREYEPTSALFSGPQGLDDYRLIIPQLRGLLTESGVTVLEIGANQGSLVSQIAEENGFSVDMRLDLADRPRALILR